MNNFLVTLTELAQDDLISSEAFYEKQAEGLGEYFRDSIIVDLDALVFYGGIHQKYFGYYRMLAKRFPYAIYYDVIDSTVVVHAILDTRKNPSWTYERLERKSI